MDTYGQQKVPVYKNKSLTRGVSESLNPTVAHISLNEMYGTYLLKLFFVLDCMEFLPKLKLR